MDSINEASKQERKRVRIREEEFTNKMKTDKGVTFVQLTPKEKDRLVKALMPLHNDCKEIMGEEYMKKVYELTDFQK
jgi:TRAP-type C4-dicarboxylate transport system substrate-binding protein